MMPGEMEAQDALHAVIDAARASLVSRISHRYNLSAGETGALVKVVKKWSAMHIAEAHILLDHESSST